jgi:hypothetical protein
MLVTIQSYTTGSCVWCCQQTEGVEVKFRDGLTGFLCKKDFWSALKARAESPPPADDKRPTTLNRSPQS